MSIIKLETIQCDNCHKTREQLNVELQKKVIGEWEHLCPICVLTIRNKFIDLIVEIRAASEVPF